MHIREQKSGFKLVRTRWVDGRSRQEAIATIPLIHDIKQLPKKVAQQMSDEEKGQLIDFLESRRVSKQREHLLLMASLPVTQMSLISLINVTDAKVKGDEEIKFDKQRAAEAYRYIDEIQKRLKKLGFNRKSCAQ